MLRCRFRRSGDVLSELVSLRVALRFSPYHQNRVQADVDPLVEQSIRNPSILLPF